MSDVAYDLNPYEIRHMLSAPGLTPVDRFVYRELLDMCWMTEDQDRIDYRPDELSVYLGMSVEDFEASINRLSRPELKILSVFLDLDSESDEMSLSVKYLTDQLETRSKRVARERKGTFSEQVEKDNTISVLDRISKRDADFEATVIYVPREERAVLKSYQGWLPTRKFDLDGEAYNIRGHLIAKLRAEFPAVGDVTLVLVEIFNWLMENPDKRPSMIRINGFIFEWFSGRNKSKALNVQDEANEEALSFFSSL